MKGLLMKDLKLIKVQKNGVMLIFAVAVLMILRTENYTFAIGYMTFIGALFALTTISYDEENNGNAFLFSLPISRNGYVMEKYVLGLLLGGFCWLFGTLLTTVAVTMKDAALLPDLFGMALLMLPFLFGLLAVMFPFQLKFGGERGRIAIMAAIGGLCLVGVAIGKAAAMFHIDLMALFRHLMEMSQGAVTALTLGVGLVVLFISYRISMAIMNRKEF